MDYDENEIMITTGSTEAIMSALFAVVNEGDEVIVPVPAFSMYKPVIELCKGRYVELNTAPDNFQITEKALASVVSDKTKAIILTSPNNPTGTILDEKSLLNVYEQVKNAICSSSATNATTSWFTTSADRALSGFRI